MNSVIYRHVYVRGIFNRGVWNVALNERRGVMISAMASIKQESCAIAKVTAQCALYMGALKIFGTP